MEDRTVIAWRVAVPHTPLRTALVLLSCVLVLAITFLIFGPYVGPLLTIAYGLYLLPAYFVPLSYSVDAVGVRWRKGLQGGGRPWATFRYYRHYPDGLELSPFVRNPRQRTPLINQYRAVFIPFGEADSAAIEQLVNHYLARDDKR